MLVSELIAALDFRLLGYRDSLRADGAAGKLSALNEAQLVLWGTLVAAGRERSTNFFAASTPATFGSGGKVASLPSNVFDVLSVEVPGAIAHASSWHKQNWRDQRANASAFASVAAADEILWQVSGSNPTQLLIGRGVTGGFTATVWYTMKPTLWTSAEEIVPPIYEPFIGVLLNYAARLLAAANQDQGVAQLWATGLEITTQTLMGASQLRQGPEAISPEDFDSVA